MNNSIWAGMSTGKGKRGRHKKDCQCDKCVLKRSAPDELGQDNGLDERPFSGDNIKDENQTELDFEKVTEDVESELKAELASDEQSETKVEGDLSSDNNSGDNLDVGAVDNDNQIVGNNRVHFTGTFVLIMLDNFLPKGIIWAAKEIGYKTDKKPSDLKLTEKEIEELSPMADEIIRKYFKTLTLEQQFIIGITVAYGSKL